MMSTCSALSTFRRLRIASFVAALVVSSTSVYAGGLDNARSALAKQDDAGAVAEFQKAVDQGDPEAMALTGTMYYYGIGVPFDTEKAFQLNLKAAEMGRVDAQFLLAMGYSERSVKNPDRSSRESEIAASLKWFKMAADGAAPKAEAGDPIAQWILGELHYRGRGNIRGDKSEAIFWLTKAAEQNVVSAEAELGSIYAYTGGQQNQNYQSGQDYQKAREWHLKAAQAGHSGSQRELGWLLDRSGDKEGTKTWYMQAALLGDPTASGYLRDHYRIYVGDPTAFDQQQADLRAKEGVLQINRMVNFGGVALGNAVTNLMGAGGGSVDDAALRHYRGQIQQNTNDLTNQVIRNMHQQDRTNTKAMQ